jgi:two-component system CheB/CheR fusion protein
VLTFTKITPVKALESKFSSLLCYIQDVVDRLKHAAIILDREGRVLVVNNAFLNMFNLREDEIKEQFFMEIVHNRWNTNKLDTLLNDRQKPELYLQHDFQGIGMKTLMISVQYVPESKTEEHAVSIVTFIEKEREQKENP